MYNYAVLLSRVQSTSFLCINIFVCYLAVNSRIFLATESALGTLHCLFGKHSVAVQEKDAQKFIRN